MTTKSTARTLSLPQNIILTILGQSVPIIVGLVTVPGLIHNIGAERFGALTIAWMLIGYFSLFDFGLGRAVTRKLSQLVAAQSPEIKSTYLTSSLFSFLLGLIGGGSLFLLAPWLAVQYLNTSEAIQGEVLNSLEWMSIALPFVISTVVFRGALEAYGEFKTINKIMAPLGSLSYGLPFVLSFFTHGLIPLIWGLIVIRITVWLLFFVFSFRQTILQPGEWRADLVILKSLLFFGFWITSANIISPIISYLDRMLIGSMVSVEAVAHYMVPMEMVQKLWLIPTAIGTVIYPAFSSLHHKNENPQHLMSRVMKTTLALLFPFGLILTVFSYEIISIWIGHDFAVKAGHSLQILGMGIWINCLGSVPLAYIQASGRPDLPAKLYFFEFPLYFGLLTLLIPVIGIEGAAIAWVVRVSIDTSLLTAFAFDQIKKVAFWRQALTLVVALNASAFSISLLPLPWRILATVVGLILYFDLIWFRILIREERLDALSRAASLLLPPQRINEDLERQDIRKIGIAMACYAPRPDFLYRQLQSIQQQTFTNWLCIATFDSDPSKLLAMPLFADIVKDPRFHFIRNRHQLGVKGNFEESLRRVVEADVDAVAFCDQDDIWEDDKLEVLRQELQMRPRLSLVHSDMRLLFETQPNHPLNGTSTWKAEARHVQFQSTYHYLVRNSVSGSGSLFDVELGRKFGKIPAEIDFHDHWITLAASLHGGVYPVHKQLYQYRQHDENIVGAAIRSGDENVKVRWRKLNYQLARAKKNWLQTRGVIRALERENMIHTPFRVVMLPVLDGIFLLLLSALSKGDDQVLSNSALVKGVGAMTAHLFPWVKTQASESNTR